MLLVSCGKARVETAKVYYAPVAPGLYAYATDYGDGTGVIRIDPVYNLNPNPAVIQHELLHLLGAFWHNDKDCILENPVRREYYDPPCESDMEVIRLAGGQMTLTVWDLKLYEATEIAIHWLNFWAGWELFNMEVI